MRPLAFGPWPLAGVGCELGVGGCGLRDGGWGALAFALAFAWALAFTSASPANGQRLMANGLLSYHRVCYLLTTTDYYLMLRNPPEASRLQTFNGQMADAVAHQPKGR